MRRSLSRPNWTASRTGNGSSARPQSVFGLVAMKREGQLEYLDNEIVEMRVALDAPNANGSEFSVKQIENAIKATTKRIDAIVAQKSSDEGLSFEQFGCDFLSEAPTTRTSRDRRTPPTCRFPTVRSAPPTWR